MMVADYASLIRPTTQATGSRTPRETLPAKWHKTVAHAARIVRVAWQLGVQELLLIGDPPDQHWHDEERRQQSPPRIKRRRRCQCEKKDPGIHRMAHQGVGSGGNDLLIFEHLDIRCAEGVLLDDKEGDVKPKGGQYDARPRHRRRHL